MIKKHAEEGALFYLVGGGIASLAAAAFLIRDGGIKGPNIRILEESAVLGGSLDAGGNATDGYIMRGGRCVFRWMWAGDSGGCGHLIPFSCGQRFRCDVGSFFSFTVIGAHMA